MLDTILDFKKAVMLNKKVINDWDSFYAVLRQEKENLNFALNSNKSHWKNYLHASLISAYMQRTIFDSVNWQEYIDKAKDSDDKNVSTLLNIPKPIDGKVLELFVMHFINHVFDFGSNRLNIHAYCANNDSNPTSLYDDSFDQNVLSPEDNTRIIENLKVIMKLRGQPQKTVWGDNDIIVTLTHNGIIQQFCIISCKISLRERVYQSIFWSMHSRMEGVGKHVFVTIDKGDSKGKSEIGNRKENNDSKKSRDVLESTMDRVYVLRNSTDVNRSQVVKDFSFLKRDLMNWAKDITGTWVII